MIQALKEAKSLSEATSFLREEGYTDTVQFENDQLVLNEQNVSPQNLVLEHTKRFEGMTNPADNTILYAVKSKDGRRKGLLIDSYGAKSSELIAEIIKEIENHDKN